MVTELTLFGKKVRAVRFQSRSAAVNGRAAAGSAANFYSNGHFPVEYRFSFVSSDHGYFSYCILLVFFVILLLL